MTAAATWGGGIDAIGPPLVPARGTWPGGAKLAVYVAVGVEHYAFGGARTEDWIAGVEGPDLVNTSWREYGNRVGSFRLFDRLRSLGIRPTVLLNTDLYDTAPEVVDAARGAAAEFAAHGASNSHTVAGMGPEEEDAYVGAVSDRMLREEGHRPRGWSSPWLEHTPATVGALAHRGFDHLLSLRPDDSPVRVTSGSDSLLAVPYALELNDSSSVIGRQTSAAEFASMVSDELDELLSAAEDRPLVMSVVLHSFISGVPFRLRRITEALERIAAAQGVWLTTPSAIVDEVTPSPETSRQHGRD
jgi:peptidoglycan/xylan/chitin deacetylase (PgdA/CDA1 family)